MTAQPIFIRETAVDQVWSLDGARLFLPRIPSSASGEVREGYALARSALLGGECLCGAVAEVIDGEWTIDHATSCAAHPDRLRPPRPAPAALQRTHGRARAHRATVTTATIPTTSRGTP